MKLSRRSFFVGVAAVAATVAASPIIPAPVRKFARFAHSRLTISDIVTDTLRNHSSEIADNVMQHNALLRRLTKDRAKDRAA